MVSRPPVSSIALPNLTLTYNQPMIFLFIKCSFSLSFYSIGRAGDQLIARYYLQQVNFAVNKPWTRRSMNTSGSAPTRLQISSRALCDANYYGSKCEIFCQARDDQWGHFTCGPDGSKICLPGWQGNYCQEGKLTQYSSLHFFSLSFHE